MQGKKNDSCLLCFLPCMYLNIRVWTEVADILLAGTPSPTSMTYSGLPVADSTNLGQFGGPEISIASFSYKIDNYDMAQVNSKTTLQCSKRRDILPGKVVKLVVMFKTTYRFVIK